MNPSGITLLVQDTFAFSLIASVFGLAVGSFLNVVIYRLPIMLDRHWRRECAAAGYAEAEESDKTAAFNLVVPRSACPHCGTPIKAWQNIPIISYLILKGSCNQCGKPISIRYPAVELLTGVLTGITAYHFGFTIAGLAAIFLLWILVALSFIDFDHQLLPDIIVLPVLWLGLLLNLDNTFTPIGSAVIGAVTGYLSLWLVFHLFKLVTGKEGMGYGDFKLFALLGAWLGWELLPLIILLSSAAGAVLGLGMILIMGRDKQLPMPFGPYLCIAGWIAMLWGNEIINSYLQLFRVSPFPG